MNQIGIQLDEALENATQKAFTNAFVQNAITVRERPDSRLFRVMFKGLSGIGKTSMIREWATDNKKLYQASTSLGLNTM